MKEKKRKSLVLKMMMICVQEHANAKKMMICTLKHATIRHKNIY
jgi:hypothetical protein